MSGDSFALLRLARQGDPAASERLVTENSGLVWSVARRFFGRGADPEDLYQLGCIGFLKAVQGFDMEYGTQFSTYAVPKIAGEIRRFLRDNGIIKVSRSIRERAFFIKSSREKLLIILGREPTLSELSAHCGLSPEDIAQTELAVSPTESLQYRSSDDAPSLENTLGDGGIEEGLVERLALRDAIDALPEKERAVIHLRYYRGMTQEKAAKILSVSQVQVSRLEHRAVAMLKRLLEVS
jgi:RNA polymerase sporulation-specific sigma factor